MQNKLFISISKNILILIVIFITFSCKTHPNTDNIYNITKSVETDSAMVVTAHPLATEIGLEVLRAGGNAIDAGIAVQFALAVCYPGAGNIGGGGFLLYREASGNTAALDYREKAPSSATETMYLDEQGNPVENLSISGPLAAGVPGTVDGMIQAFEKYSRLRDWNRLLQPAINLAAKGFLITKNEAEHLNDNQEKFKRFNRTTTAFHKDMWKAGDLLVQKDLAETLTRIAKNGRAGFYEGTTAQLILDEMKGQNGIINLKDLKDYRAVWRKPVVYTYRGNEIISMPPPSSGGIALGQLLKIIEPYDMKALGFQSAAAVHLITEAERRVYADRAHYLGDPDFINVPQETLLDSTYLTRRMADFNPRQASKSQNIRYGTTESEETTHYSIVDSYGNALSVTTTLNGSYGSHTVVRGAGFILNNEMDDFSIKPGTPNLYGLVGAEANKIEPGKRMLSSMTPTIISQNGKLKMVVGTPGGSTIITSVFQIIINVLDFEMDINKAVQSPRFHHQWLPDVIYCETDAIQTKQRKILESIGHTFKNREPLGRVEGILIDKNNTIHGAADHRGDDDAKGF